MRCLKFGADCEGYGQIPKSNRRLTLRDILPRASHCPALLAPSRTELPLTTSFQDEREYKYFLHFQEEAALELSGPFDTSLWNHVILQACQDEPFLRRLTASIGALNKATRIRALNCCDEEANSHYQYALQKYGRALRGIQESISAAQTRDSTRIALITSLLVYCFENLHGDLELAITHMRSALQLMHKQLSHTKRHYRHIQNISPTPALEDVLVASFVRVDNALLSNTSNPSAKKIGSCIVRPSILDINYSEDIYNIPYRFNTITEARNYLENFQFRALPSLAHEFGVQIYNSPESVNDTARDMYTTMSSQLRQWRAAFAPLYAESYTSAGSRNSIAAIMLRVQALSTDLAAKRICARGMSSSDPFISESREIIDLSKLVAADPSFRKTFVFDCGIVPGLFIVVFTCLDMSMRKEALDVLRQIVPRREGVWDSSTLVRQGEMALQIEHSRTVAVEDVRQQ